MIVLKALDKEYKHWESVDIQLRLNTVASEFRLVGLMTQENRNIFKPFGYTECEVWIIDDDKGINEKLITGYLVNPGITTQKKPTLTTISGFSRPGILEKINFPPSMWPLQWNKTNLRTIAQKVADKFDLTLKIHPGAASACEEIFQDQIKCKPTEYIKAFLSRIGEKKGVTVAHDNLGNLFLYRILNTIEASSQLTQGDYHIAMSTSPNGQNMHSHITAYKENSLKDRSEGEVKINQVGSYTAKSPFIKNMYLPRTIMASNTEDGSLKEYADREIAKEARNMPVTASKIGWDFAGRIVRAGFYLDLEAPDLFIEKTKFLVESMSFTKGAKGQEQLSFTCLLPCVYTGVPPSKTPYTI